MVKVQIDHKDLLIYNTFNFGFIHFYKKKNSVNVFVVANVCRETFLRPIGRNLQLRDLIA